MTSHALSREDIKLLGEQRLLALSGSCLDTEIGFSAFQWEMAARTSLLPVIAITEIILRNAMDEEIQRWWESEGYPGFWTCDNGKTKATPIHPFVHTKEWKQRAASNISRKDRLIGHDDLIAHTSFGTWKNMIGNPLSIPSQIPTDISKRNSWEALKRRDAQCALLWKNVLSNAFPHMPPKSKRKGISPRAYIGARITRVSSLRNRICHWDSLSKVNISMRYMDMQEIVGAISPNMRQFIVDSYDDEILSAINNKPSWLVEESK